MFLLNNHYPFCRLILCARFFSQRGSGFLQNMLDEDDVKVAADALKELEALMPHAERHGQQRSSDHRWVPGVALGVGGGSWRCLIPLFLPGMSATFAAVRAVVGYKLPNRLRVFVLLTQTGQGSVSVSLLETLELWPASRKVKIYLD